MKLDDKIATHNSNIVEAILKSKDIKNATSLFLILLKGIKENYNLRILLNSNIIEESIYMVSYIDNVFEKAKAINAILSIMYDTEYDCNKNKYFLHKLFESFLLCLENNDFATIKETIFLFYKLGIDYDFIFIEFMTRYSKEFCIQLFSSFNYSLNPENLMKYRNFIHLIETSRKHEMRFDMILHFYAMINLQHIKEATFISDYLTKYYNCISICADWLFSSEGNKYDYVLNNIISQKEEEMFVAIGDIYYSCMDDSVLCDTEDELWNYIKIASDNFCMVLQSKEVKKLIDQFKNGRDFMDIAVNFPNSL